MKIKNFFFKKLKELKNSYAVSMGTASPHLFTLEVQISSNIMTK